MKMLTFLITIFSISIALADLDDSSFTNKKRYIFLREQQIDASTKVHLNINFVPPNGKKVNSASFIKLWERNNTEWKLVEKLGPTVDVFNDQTNIFDAYIDTPNKNLPLALEVEFIHCEKFGGGQCAMERYLGKIKRTHQSTKHHLNYRLKI